MLTFPSDSKVKLHPSPVHETFIERFVPSTMLLVLFVFFFPLHPDCARATTRADSGVASPVPRPASSPCTFATPASAPATALSPESQPLSAPGIAEDDIAFDATSRQQGVGR